jgi:hypothetical protein
MKTPNHLCSVHDIAEALGKSFGDTLKFLKKNDIKPPARDSY